MGGCQEGATREEQEDGKPFKHQREDFSKQIYLSHNEDELRAAVSRCGGGNMLVTVHLFAVCTHVLFVLYRASDLRRGSISCEWASAVQRAHVLTDSREYKYTRTIPAFVLVGGEPRNTKQTPFDPKSFAPSRMLISSSIMTMPAAVVVSAASLTH